MERAPQLFLPEKAREQSSREPGTSRTASSTRGWEVRRNMAAVLLYLDTQPLCLVFATRARAQELDAAFS